MKNLGGGVWACLLVAGLSGCSVERTHGAEEPEGPAATLRLMVQAEEAGEVVAAQMIVHECESKKVLFEKRAELSYWAHEVMTPSYLEGEESLFLEYELSLVASCVEVGVELIARDASGEVSCTEARGREVSLSVEQPREILLLGRCGKGPETPGIEMVSYSPTAFVGCGQSVEVCATLGPAVPTSGEPTVEFHRHGGVPLPENPVLKLEKEPAKTRKSCALFKPYYQGEMIGRIALKNGEESAAEEVLFSLFTECRERPVVEANDFVPDGK